MSTAVSEVTEVGSDDERRPLMTSGNIAWMNLGFFGVQFSFGLTQTSLFLTARYQPDSDRASAADGGPQRGW